jgi:hypothetical protein
VWIVTCFDEHWSSSVSLKLLMKLMLNLLGGLDEESVLSSVCFLTSIFGSVNLVCVVTNRVFRLVVCNIMHSGSGRVH